MEAKMLQEGVLQVNTVLGNDQYKAVVPMVNVSPVDYRLHAGQLLGYAKPVDLVVARDAHASIPCAKGGLWLQTGGIDCELGANGRDQPRSVARDRP